MASATPLEPYNVWEDVPSTMDINLSSIETDDNDSTITTTSNYSNNSKSSKSSKSSGGGSPTRYSVQTIRQKKGRQLLSTMMGAEEVKDGNSSVGRGGGLFPTAGTLTVTVEETKVGENEGGSKKTVTTTTRTATTSSSSGKSSTSTSNPAAAGGADSHADGAGASAGDQVGLGKAPLHLGGGGGRGGRGGFPSVGLYQGIGRVQAFSAMAFSAFAVIHLVPPMLASVGGVELANKALLWGRVFYQTNGLEQVLVSGSLLVHLGAGLCKAVIRMVWKVKSYYSDSSSSTSPRVIEDRDTPTVNKESSTTTNASGSTTTTTKITTITKTTGGSGSGSASAPGLFPYHRLAGWILTPMVIAHMNDMRLAPLEVLGDSSMVDYSFVTYLHRIGRSGPYILLVGLLAYHMFGGGPVAFNMLLPKGSGRRVKVQDLVRSKKVRGGFAAVVVGVVVVGTARIMFAEGPIPLSRVYLSLLDL